MVSPTNGKSNATRANTQHEVIEIGLLGCSHSGRYPIVLGHEPKEQQRIADFFYISQHHDQYCSHPQSAMSPASPMKDNLHRRSDHSNISNSAFITRLLLVDCSCQVYMTATLRTGSNSEPSELSAESRKHPGRMAFLMLLSNADILLAHNSSVGVSSADGFDGNPLVKVIPPAPEMFYVHDLAMRRTRQVTNHALINSTIGKFRHKLVNEGIRPCFTY